MHFECVTGGAFCDLLFFGADRFLGWCVIDSLYRLCEYGAHYHSVVVLFETGARDFNFFFFE